MATCLSLGLAATPAHAAGATTAPTLGSVADVSVAADPSGSEPPSSLELVGSNGTNGNRLSHAVQVPRTVEPGDALLLHWAANTTRGTVTPPSGWSEITSTAGDGVRGGMWLRTAEAGDAGSTVAIETSAYAKSDVGVTAYRDAHDNVVDDWEATVQSAVGDTHEAPAVTPAHDGSWVVTYVADKSSTDTTLTVPDTLTSRRTSAGSDGGHITATLADTAGAVETGVAAGPYAFDASTTGRSVAFTVAVRPASGATQPQTQPQTQTQTQTQTESGSANMLTNGCTYTDRGLPSCGAYFGGVTGANGDPSSIERDAGATYGVRRTYWGPDGVGGAVKTAREDVAENRVPWISFKLPHSYADMAAGRGDAWVRDLVNRLDAIDGPVWLAFHHEPENDNQPIQQWVAMQEHLGPMVRNGSDSVAFSVILMGWHQWYGADHLRIENMWPDTKVDVAGFDVYNFQGTPDGNGVRTKGVDFENDYFKVIDAWAQKEDVAWGLGETGVTDYSTGIDPTWIQDTYQLLERYNGVAFSYFNSSLHSQANWTLDRPGKAADFQAALKSAPTMR